MNNDLYRESESDWQARATMIAAIIEKHASECDATDAFVEEGYAALRQEGFFKALVPAEFGGGDASVSDIARAMRPTSTCAWPPISGPAASPSRPCR